MGKHEEIYNKVKDGELAVLKFTSMDGKLLRVETFDGVEMLDLLIESNSERMGDLLTLYDEQEIIIGDERVALVCGTELIAQLMIDTAYDIKDSVDFSAYVTDEQFENYLALLETL